MASSACYWVAGALVLIALYLAWAPLFFVGVGVALAFAFRAVSADAGAAHMDYDDAASVASAASAAASDVASVASVDSYMLSRRRASSSTATTAPPAPPIGEVAAFRALVDEPLSSQKTESVLDQPQYMQRLNRGREPSLRHYYTAGRDAAERAIRSELPLNDPHLVPLDGERCKRSLGKL